jgi:hypothetical protein
VKSGSGDRDEIQLLREDGWLRLRAPAPAVGDPWELLARNARRRGPARFVLVTEPGNPAHFVPELVVDLPVAGGIEQLAGIAQARAICGEPAAGASESPPASPDWAALLDASGWPATPRGSERIAVELESPGASAQARLLAGDDGASLSVELARADGVSPTARLAIAHHVLILTGQVRMVRAIASESRDAVLLDVRLPATASPRDLDLALSALSMGVRLAARELRALADDRLAALYLDYLHPTRTPCDSMKEPAFSCSM